MDSVEISDSNRSVFENLTEGQITRLIDPTRVGQTLEGLVVTERIQAELRAWVMEQNKQEGLGIEVNDTIDLTVNTAGGLTPENSGVRTLRYPKDAGIKHSTDYVFFQFGKYKPPFKGSLDDKQWSAFNEELQKLVKDQKEGWQSKKVRDYIIKNSGAAPNQVAYNASSKIKPEGYDIMLPMPQDLSNELQASWQGKQFTATGRAAIAALGAGNFSYAKEVVANIAGNAKALQTALNTSVLNSIPGVGGNLDFNDVSGATRGIVINPNAELMYDSPQMREIGMIFKLVAQNPDEAKIIRKIITRFRQASLPSWGDNGQYENLFGGEGSIVGSEIGRTWNNWFSDNDKKDNRNKDKLFDITTADNWIRVPNLCQFTFMTGSNVNRKLIQFKPCAIQAVEVNYTPDGTYATYSDGSPVAIELRLNFMETKLLYSNEVGYADERKDDTGMGY